MELAHLETNPREVLDPSAFDDETWANRLRADDPSGAREAFVTDLREGPTRTVPETDGVALRRRWVDADPGYDRGFDLDPDAVVEGRHVGVYGIEHRFEDGIDWFYDASADAEEQDFTREWQWQLNRHYQWITLADAYEETGDRRYAEAFEEELRSWLSACPRPDDSGRYYPSAWRTLETGARAGWIWPYAFETFRRSDHVSDEALWWWLCSFREHGQHLLRYVTADNWKMAETNGLVHVGGMFPELAGAGTFLSTGIDRAIAEIERQFYPDGLQTELAPGYALMTVMNCYSTLELARECGAADYGWLGVEVPDRTHERLAESARAYARLAAPDGRCPKLHDSRTVDPRPLFEDFHEGTPPWEAGRSDHIPWGGYGILRNEGRYALLDAGPYGSNHQHQDTLQVVGYADGAWTLVDPGSPQYADSPITSHIRSAAGHNVALLDGERHSIRPEIHRARSAPPMALAENGPLAATAATRTFETDEGSWFDHERVLCDVSGVGWLVFDRLSPRDTQKHTAEWIWQTTSDASADGDGGTLAGDSVSTTLSVASPIQCTMTTAFGETDPYRGWGSTEETKEHEPLPTLRVQSGEWTDGVEALSLLSPVDARLVDGSFDEEARTVDVDAGDDRYSITVEDVSGRVGSIGLDGPAGEVGVSIDDHDLLAGE